MQVVEAAQAIDYLPGETRGLEGLGIYYEDQGDYEKALDALGGDISKKGKAVNHGKP